MAYACKILADSLNTANDCRLITFAATYPRYIHSEFMTHRMLSKNSASSRAIPSAKMRERVISDPVTPIRWGSLQKGMQAGEDISEEKAGQAYNEWIMARDKMSFTSDKLESLGVHKQWANRVTEPWMWITVIVSATEWGNFFNLRCHPDAQPEFQHIANMMRDLYFSHQPTSIDPGGWHLPLIGFPGDEELTLEQKIRVAIGRCARVSYLTHDGKRDIQADLDLHDRLLVSGHMSPFEHVAEALFAYPLYNTTTVMLDNTYTGRLEIVTGDLEEKFYGNFRGWLQARKFILNENRSYYEHLSSNNT